MTQITEEKAMKLVQTRLAKFQVKLTDDDVRAFLTLCLAQGWKFTARDPSNSMLQAAPGVKFAAGSEPHTTEALWAQMWERA